MPGMTMRERILAVLKGWEVDLVPFVCYDMLIPVDETLRELGQDRVGLLRWCKMFKVEHPHCAFAVENERSGERLYRTTKLHTPLGTLSEVRVFTWAMNPELDYGGILKHFVEVPADYDTLCAYLEDCTILENYDQWQSDAAELGDHGWPLPYVERTPYQQLWIEWAGMEGLAVHMADYPERVARTLDLLRARERRIFDIACQSPAPFIDVPDNITAPTIGPRRFRELCVPLYNELADRLAEQGKSVVVHMDGQLKPLWHEIAGLRITGIDSLTPVPDCDTSVAQAAAMWPDKRLWVNFPSSIHIASPTQIRATADEILAAAGHSGRLQIQISENMPPDAWRTSFPIIVDAISAYGKPAQ